MDERYEIGDVVTELADWDIPMGCMVFIPGRIEFFQFTTSSSPDVLLRFQERHPIRMSVIKNVIFIFIRNSDEWIIYTFSPVVSREFRQAYTLPVGRKLEYTLYLVEEGSRRVCAYHKGCLSERFSQTLTAACLEIGMRNETTSGVRSELELLMELYSYDDLYYTSSDYGSI